MTKTTGVVLAALVAATSCGGGISVSPSQVPPTLKVADDPTLGKILVGGNGMTLYVFSADTPDQSNCYDVCEEDWPPLVVTGKPTLGPGLASPSKVGTASRKGGSTQVTYDGRPLYFYIEDGKPGIANGEKVNQDGGIWFVVRNP